MLATRKVPSLSGRCVPRLVAVFDSEHAVIDIAKFWIIRSVLEQPHDQRLCRRFMLALRFPLHMPHFCNEDGNVSGVILVCMEREKLWFVPSVFMRVAISPLGATARGF